MVRFRVGRGWSQVATNGNLEVGSNVRAGGAIFSWKCRGIEYVNSRDYGRLFQAAMFASVHDGIISTYDSSLPRRYNPTEAGAGGETSVDTWQGSPVARISPNGLNSRAVPLEFIPRDFAPDHQTPVIYPQARLGKELELNSHYAGLQLPYLSNYRALYYSPVAMGDFGFPEKFSHNSPSRTISFYLMGKFSDTQFMFFASSRGPGGSIPRWTSIGHAGSGQPSAGDRTANPFEHVGLIMSDPRVGTDAANDPAFGSL